MDLGLFLDKLGNRTQPSHSFSAYGMLNLAGI
jgi:hypothetical protein